MGTTSPEEGDLEMPDRQIEEKQLVQPVNDENLAGNLTTLGNSFIAFVGAGILDLPYAFSKVGLGLGTVVIIGVAIICLHCMYLLVDCKLFLERQGKKIVGYGDVGFHAYGSIGAKIVDVSLVVTQFGFCTAYLILISNSLYTVLEGSPGVVPFIWLCVPGELMLSTLRHLKYLGKFSIIADITMAFAITTVVYYCRKEIGSHTPQQAQRMEANIPMVPYFFGASIYCFEGIGMVIPIQNAMRNKHQFKLVWGLNMVLVTMLFWGVGWLGYKAYGVSIRESVAGNLPPFDRLTAMVQIAISTGLYFTFPVMMFPVYQILESTFFPSVDAATGSTQTMALRFSVVFLSAIVATLVPSFSDFIVLVGSSTCALLAFIFPALFSLKIRGLRPIAVAREGTIIVLGVVAAILGTRDALKRIAG
eukprot:TRINITY_DN2448_c1_g2_i1.p1 TRINITY_DN2448_c1_g2~~TRINITY_DN2448_c1_g2_i1.p1  ORF type:complete len:419 (+),score=11.79 TRINITY_DN2448_c1_g2_i1:61-1317(+)